MKGYGAIGFASLLLGGLVAMVYTWRRREKKFWSRTTNRTPGPGGWFV